MAVKRVRPHDNKVLLYGSIAVFVVSYFWLDLSGRDLIGMSNNLRFLIDTPVVIFGVWLGIQGVIKVRGDKKAFPIFGLVLCSLDLLFILWAFIVFNLN